MKRGKLTVEQWTRLIEGLEASRMDQRAFAAKAGVSFSGLKYWLYKVRRQRVRVESLAKSSQQRVSFVEVKPQPARAGGRIEIDLPSGVVVRFDASTEAKVIGEVTQALISC